MIHIYQKQIEYPHTQPDQEYYVFLQTEDIEYKGLKKRNVFKALEQYLNRDFRKKAPIPGELEFPDINSCKEYWEEYSFRVWNEGHTKYKDFKFVLGYKIALAEKEAKHFFT